MVMENWDTCITWKKRNKFTPTNFKAKNPYIAAFLLFRAPKRQKKRPRCITVNSLQILGHNQSVSLSAPFFTQPFSNLHHLSTIKINLDFPIALFHCSAYGKKMKKIQRRWHGLNTKNRNNNNQHTAERPSRILYIIDTRERSVIWKEAFCAPRSPPPHCRSLCWPAAAAAVRNKYLPFDASSSALPFLLLVVLCILIIAA